ncbi:hypothetical protein DAPPUDRAFT_320839 [Daphnia pulex]|uniref:Uncharacterized protein n=1 Tax=Daphnia pulex TaxID=6669 RepID=E9GR78_DAPPU|nr:hypothetical protein DAPPUDRAFT_320839 [Daphnia pulex]|eukprot:EFX77963.1 hypothetical protein DAPPUDRAFT_320839 [Daphnia pulex]
MSRNFVFAQNFLKNFVSEQSLEVLDFSTELSRRQRDIVGELAYALNLDVCKVHDGREDRVQVKVMHCLLHLAMDIFWLMYQVVGEEDDHPIFRKASLCNRNLM